MSSTVRLAETRERTIHITKDAMLELVRQSGYEVPVSDRAVVRYVEGHVLITWSEQILK